MTSRNGEWNIAVWKKQSSFEEADKACKHACGLGLEKAWEDTSGCNVRVGFGGHHWMSPESVAERRIAAWNKRKALTFNQAIDKGLFNVECCTDCGAERTRLYIQLEGMYAGNRYCRACAIETLKSEHF